MIIGQLMDAIPWWAYVTVGLLIVGLLCYFFSPILIPLWRVTPNWVKVAVAFVIALFLAFVKGRNTGFQNAKRAREKADANAIKNRAEVDATVRNLPPVERDRRLDKWMRD